MREKCEFKIRYLLHRYIQLQRIMAKAVCVMNSSDETCLYSSSFHIFSIYNTLPNLKVKLIINSYEKNI